jgi:hypothetical protein
MRLRHALGYEVFENALRGYSESYARDEVLTVPTICWINVGSMRRR